MSTLLSVSIAALAGLLMTRVFNLWRLPDVTAYLVAGVLIGPYVLGSMHITGLGLVSADAVSSLQLVSEVALGFIAFSIGNEFRLEDLKSTGNQAAIIGVVQALTATLLVDTALLTVHMLLPEKLSAAQAITLGAIATATAPFRSGYLARRPERRFDAGQRFTSFSAGASAQGAFLPAGRNLCLSSRRRTLRPAARRKSRKSAAGSGCVSRTARRI